MSRQFPHGRSSSLGDGLNLTAEFLAALLTWGGVGWFVDRWLGIAPWALIIGLVVGNACGIYLLWLRTRSPEEIERAVNARRRERE
jgi:F0F1-type ATP synthase assembly protein I